MNIILNNEIVNARGLRVNTGKHRTGGQQSADGNVNAEELRVNTYDLFNLVASFGKLLSFYPLYSIV